MFSSRTRWDRTENRVAAALRLRRSRGLPVIDLTETNPTCVGLPLPTAEVLDALASPAAMVYDPQPFGLEAAREAVARAHLGVVPPGRVVLSASTSEAYALLFKLLCDPGDRVLAPAPSYPLFEYLAAAEGVELDSYPTAPLDGFAIDLVALEARITTRTKAILVVAPNNPSGALLRRAELAALTRMCRARDLALIADEVFADWLTRPPPPDSVPSLAGHAECLTFVLSGLSKSCLLPQLKLAWTLVQGPEPQVREALGRLELLADTLLSVGQPVQLALPRLLQLRPALQGPLRVRLEANRATLRAAVERGCVTALPADGGWAAVLRVPRLHSEEAWVLGLLEEEGVLVHPGYFFDFPGTGWLVLSLLPEETQFRDAVARLVRFVEERAFGC
jgi:hypothetical protein